MKSPRKISRRAVARHLGTLAGGTALLGPGIAHALARTPSQTAGPFYPPEPHSETDVDLTLLDGHTERAAGDVILIRGRVTDLDGNPLAEARVDIWQANHYGRYTHPRDRNTAPLDPNFQGIGIARTDADGWYGFRTIRPAPYALAFVGDQEDLVMRGTPKKQRQLLITSPVEDEATGLPVHRFDIALG
jgi:protocatechuate 3,4-dioxygenase beta subunit